MSPIFKVNDIRGSYPSELNEAEIKKIGHALAHYFGNSAEIVIGHDARLSSPALYKALIEGIMNYESGIRVKSGKSKIHNSKFIIHKAGLMTTPMLYFLVGKNKADGGIMVTASHNPKEYNGLKIVGKEARPIGGKEIGSLVLKLSAA